MIDKAKLIDWAKCRVMSNGSVGDEELLTLLRVREFEFGQETGQQLYDRVEAEYWAQHPEAVPTDIVKGEIVASNKIGRLGVVTDVRDAGRTISVAWLDTPDGTSVQNVLTHKLLRTGRYRQPV